MTDDKKAPEGVKPAEGSKDSDTSGKDVSPTPEALKALTDQNTDLMKKLGAQEKQSQAAQRKLEGQIKVLEAAKAPPEDSARIANLEVELARSKAVSLHGLSSEDAELLKGTPAEILDDAAYWAQRVKVTTPATPAPETNRELIDKKVEGVAAPVTPAKPAPKVAKEGLWIDQYKAANPAERYKMDQDVKNGLVDPTQ